MKNFLLGAFIVVVATGAPARAIPVASCPSELKPQPICADAELARLDNAIVTRFDRLISRADSLTALLLKRDQRWFQSIIDGGDPANLGVKFESEATKKFCVSESGNIFQKQMVRPWV